VVRYDSRHNHLHSFFSYESISKYLFFCWSSNLHVEIIRRNLLWSSSLYDVVNEAMRKLA
jgi:hypothetical protein